MTPSSPAALLESVLNPRGQQRVFSDLLGELPRPPEPFGVLAPALIASEPGLGFGKVAHAVSVEALAPSVLACMTLGHFDFGIPVLADVHVVFGFKADAAGGVVVPNLVDASAGRMLGFDEADDDAMVLITTGFIR